jgi:hypothetical protein
MTEQKKPYPDNKHETRLVTEARPAGIAASTYREQDGKSVDMIEVVGEKPRITRIAQAAYDRMVSDGTQLFEHDYFIPIPAGAPGALIWHSFANIPIPAGMALDVTAAHFMVFTDISGGAGAIPHFVPVPDTVLLRHVVFDLRIDRTSPWDRRLHGANVVLGTDADGLPWLNIDVLSLGGDCPTHIVAKEGQTLSPAYFWYDGTIQTLLGSPNTTAWGARIKGRWIPIQHYKRIIGANSLE